MATHLAASRTYPVAPHDAFATLLPHPLPALFSRRFLAIPPIRSVSDDGTPWRTVGQQRMIELADGGRLRETLMAVDEPRSFAYHLDQVSGPMRLLIQSVEGRWLCEPVGTGTRVTWTWDLTPTAAAGRAAMGPFGRMWQGYARQALEHLEHALVAEHR